MIADSPAAFYHHFAIKKSDGVRNFRTRFKRSGGYSHVSDAVDVCEIATTVASPHTLQAQACAECLPWVEVTAPLVLEAVIESRVRCNCWQVVRANVENVVCAGDCQAYYRCCRGFYGGIVGKGRQAENSQRAPGQ